MGLHRPLFGEMGVHLDDSSEAGASTKFDLLDVLRESIRGPAVTMMRDCGHVNIPRSCSHDWEEIYRYAPKNSGSRT